MDLSSVVPNSTPPRFVNSQLVSLPPVGILNKNFCSICICICFIYTAPQACSFKYKPCINKVALPFFLYQERYLPLKEQIDKQMMQYAVCSEDLNEIEQDLHNADYNDEQFDPIAPNTQNVELQDEAEGTEDLHPDFSENYDLSDDLSILSTSLNNEPLILNEFLDCDFREMV